MTNMTYVVNNVANALRELALLMWMLTCIML
jgi:hypothetical protein